MSKTGRWAQREPRGYLVEELYRQREGPEVGLHLARSQNSKEIGLARAEKAGEGQEMRTR